MIRPPLVFPGLVNKMYVLYVNIGVKHQAVSVVTDGPDGVKLGDDDLDFFRFFRISGVNLHQEHGVLYVLVAADLPQTFQNNFNKLSLN